MNEPADNFPRWVWPVLAAVLLLCIPWWTPQSWVEPVVWALPLWSAIMVGAFTLLAVVTAWVFHSLWREDDGESGEDAP